jgi:hypothetical protein
VTSDVPRGRVRSVAMHVIVREMYVCMYVLFVCVQALPLRVAMTGHEYSRRPGMYVLFVCVQALRVLRSMYSIGSPPSVAGSGRSAAV